MVFAQERVVFAQSQRCGGKKSLIDVINLQNWTTVDSIGIQTSELAVLNILQWDISIANMFKLYSIK